MNKTEPVKVQGFTLLELMVALTVVGVIIGFGIPGIQNTIYNNQRLSAFQQLYGTLQSARSEAITRASPVTVCKRNSAGSDCDNSASWDDGWIIFADSVTTGSVQSSEEIFRVFEDVSGDIDITGNGGSANYVTFSALGRSSTAATITICDPRGSSYARGIVISSSGRLKSSNSGLSC